MHDRHLSFALRRLRQLSTNLHVGLQRTGRTAYNPAMLACIVALIAFAPKTLELVPKETIWVYENASTPADGTFLRAWGNDGKSCPADGEDLGQFSYSFLKWDLSDVPKDAKVVSATLEMNNIADPGFTIEGSKKAPLEARALIGDFDAKTWTFDKATKVRPDGTKDGLYGAGSALAILAGSPVQISIELKLNSGAFSAAMSAAIASPSHSLSLCITSALDPSVEGRTCIYKLYGQNESKASLRPTLKLVFESTN